MNIIILRLYLKMIEFELKKRKSLIDYFIYNNNYKILWDMRERF